MHNVPMTDYKTAYDAFQWDVPKTFNFGTEVLDRWAEDEEKLALIWLNSKGEEKRFTFHQIKILSNQFANLLRSRGVKKGDRVIVMLPRVPEWQIALIGCNKLGAVPVPCVTMLTEKDVTYRVNHSEAVAAVTTTENVGKFGKYLDLTVRISVGGSDNWIDFMQGLEGQSEDFAAPSIKSEDPAIMYSTSGSTGEPKGVLHSARSLFAWRVSARYWLNLQENDLVWCTADTGWSKAGTSVLYGPWSSGAATLFYNGHFDRKARIDFLEKFKVTVYCASATELRQLISLDLEEHDLHALRQTVSAGEPVDPEVVRQWQTKTGSLLLDGYGQTETLMTVVNYPCMPVKPGSMGRPLPSTEVAILGEGNRPLPAGCIGQLAVKCPNPQIMLGYWRDEKRSAETRGDDIINSAGYRIGPTEVENTLLEHEAVKECAVVGSTDEERGEIVKAFVTLNNGYEGNLDLELELQDFAKRFTAPYKYPRKIEFVAFLPKTATGKLSRRILKDHEYGKIALDLVTSRFASHFDK